MASIPNSPFFYSLKPTKTCPNTNPRTSISKSFKLSSSSDQSFEPENQESELDPVKLAFAKAKAYKKKSITPNPVPPNDQNPVRESAEKVDKIDGSSSDFDGKSGSVALEKTKEYGKNRVEGSEGISGIYAPLFLSQN